MHATLFLVACAFVAPPPLQFAARSVARHAALRCVDEEPEDAAASPDTAAWRSVRNQLSRSWQGDEASVDDEWAHTLPLPEQGCLLLAKPNVRFNGDPAKMLSVVLILSHSDTAGTVGLALNRPTDHKLQKVLEGGQILEAFGDRPIHLGGPSQPVHMWRGSAEGRAALDRPNCTSRRGPPASPLSPR